MAVMLMRNPRLHLQLLVESRTRPRWASSDSSPDPPKPEKKLSDRLSAVNDRKLPPEIRGRSNGVGSETDIMNVVEQRIWHSMEEGQFENLPGKGKPLDLMKSNPHVDPAEDTLYRILMRNGCAPEWVELNKEIRCKINEWRVSLKKAWAKKLDGHDAKWVEESEALKAQLRAINDKECSDMGVGRWVLLKKGERLKRKGESLKRIEGRKMIKHKNKFNNCLR